MSRRLTQQDISWFIDLQEKGQLDLDPPYQRRSVWSPRDKRFFVDTILNDYPAPPIFLHKTIDEKGRTTYHVVDGKQRLQTILEFTDNKVPIPENFSDINLQKKRWQDLERVTRERFWNYILVVEMLADDSDASIKNIFDRINRNSRKLVPQEMRHAKYDGWFIGFAEAEAEKAEWKRFGVVTPARIKRMADVQFISELLAVILRKAIQGFDQNSLDVLYAEYEDISSVPDFIEDDFAEVVESTKASISELLNSEPEVRKYLRVQSHFYTLWSYLVLDRDRYPGPSFFAPQYKDFMEAVAEAVAVSDVRQAEAATQDEQEATSTPRAIVDYASSFRGATTDLKPRMKRHAALVEVMSGHEDIASEDR